MTIVAGKEQVGTEFRKDISATAVGVRNAFAELVSALPGNIARAREMQYALDLDYKLCWRVFHVIRATDTLGAAHQVPKPPSMRLLIRAAEKKGVSGEIVGRLKRAAEEFEQAVEVHGGNRQAFDSMVTGVSSADGGNQVDLIERRNAFRANSHIWGSQVDTFMAATIIRRSAGEAELVDRCRLTARLGWRRFRPGASTVGYGTFDPKATDHKPLDEEAAARYGVSLLPGFCTHPLPQFERVENRGGRQNFWTKYELSQEVTGKTVGVDLVFGDAMWNTPPMVEKEKRVLGVGVEFRRPAARVLCDLVVHRASFGKISPLMKVYEVLGEWSVNDLAEKDLLPVRGEVVQVGGGIDAASTPELPRQAETLRYACEKMGWDAGEFDLYRLMMEYPVLNSFLHVGFSY